MTTAAGGADGEHLLERDDALAVLRAALARALGGDGQVVLLSGEAGIGKTALTRALCASADRGTRILEGACDALFLPRPLGPFADVAAELGGRLAELVDRGAPPYQILTPLLALLEERPTILVLEDLHWADEATLDVFRLLARRVRTLPALVLATYRDESLSPTNPLALVQGDVARLRNTTRLQLHALSPVAVAALAEPYELDPGALFRSTGGNPFFVTEVLAAPGQRIPPTARDAVLSRVSPFSPAGRALLEAVAICPPSVDLGLLDRLSEDAPALTECISSGMLVETGRDIAFRHELARLAVETSIPPDRRRRLHERALVALAEPARGQPDVARLAHHAEAADDAAAVLHYAIAAAEHAAALGAHREAAEQYARALRFADGLSNSEIAELYRRRSRECYVSDQADAAIEALHHARRCHADIGDTRGEGDTLASLANISWCPSHIDEAIKFGEEAVRILETLPPGRELCRAYLILAFIHTRGLDGARAARWIDRGAAIAEQIGDEVWLCEVEIASAKLAMATLSTDGFDNIDRARDHAEMLGLARVVLDAHVATADAARAAHIWSRLDASTEAGLAISREHGYDLDANYLYASAAQADLARGRWNDAIERAELILTTPTVSTYPRTIAHVVIGLVRARRGDPDAQTSLDRAHGLAEQAGEFPRLALLAAARAEHAWLRGQSEEVAEITDPVLRCARRPGDAAIITELHVWRRRAGIVEAVPADASEPHLHELSGDPMRAAAAWHALGCPYEAAVAMGNAPDPDGLQQAHQALIDIGARPAAAIVARRLREIGAGGLRRGPRPSTSTNPAQLTSREMDVLRLLSSGLQNKQIASRLYLSPKTVDHHVSAVLRKLDARTRGEATAAAARLGLVATEAT